MSGSRECECGASIEAGDAFCSRGHFAGWETPRGGTQPDGAAVRVAEAPPASHGSGAGPGVDLHSPTDPDPTRGDPVVPVEAGQAANLNVIVRNRSLLVDAYTISVEGFDPAWWKVEPGGATKLMPFSEPSGFEAEITIIVEPPASPKALAQDWPVEIVVTPERGGIPTRAPAIVRILPFSALHGSALPTAVAGRRSAQFEARIENRGNHPADVALAAEDPEGLTRAYTVREGSTQVPPGVLMKIPMEVVPRKRLWYGHSRSSRANVTARALGASDVTFPVTYRQIPLIPRWAPLLLVALLLLVLLLFLLLRPTDVKVPNVTGELRVADAHKELVARGLRLDPRIQEVGSREGVPGEVVEQVPAAGEPVPRGTQVVLTAVRGATKFKVPKLDGSTVAEADILLRGSNLSLGQVEPGLDAPGVVVAQVPGAGAIVPSGEPVMIAVGKPRSRRRGQGGDAAGDKAEAKAKGKAKPVPELPATGGVAAAAKAIRKAGLTPIIEPTIDLEERGTILSTQPEAGKTAPGGAVTLSVSAGYPRLVYDNSSNVVVASAADGTGRTTVAPDGIIGTGSAWREDGKLVAFTKGRRLLLARPGADPFVISLAAGLRPRSAVIPVATDLRLRPTYPTFAPSLEVPTVLAFVDKGTTQRTSNAVCWVRIANGKPVRRSVDGKKLLANGGVSCKKIAGWRIVGLSYGSGGEEMLLSVKKDDYSRKGVMKLKLRPGRPTFSAKADDWTYRNRLVTRTKGGRGVSAAVFSPDGEDVALVSDLGGEGNRVAVVEARRLQSRTPVTPKESETIPGNACDVAWRSDSKEIVVVMQVGAKCGAFTKGPIVRLDPSKPDTRVLLVASGRHPSLEPVDVDPGALSLGR